MANNRELSQFANVVGYNSGDIGIGTDNPGAKLEVRDGSSQGIIIRSDSTQATDTNKALRVRNNSDTNTFHVSHRGQGYFAGNIGIGTNNPTSDLSVVSYGDHGKIRVESSGDGNRAGVEFFRESSAGTGKGAAGIWVESETGNSTGELRFGTASNASLQSLSTKMILDSSGDLGIGTDNPRNSSKLDVHNSTASGVYINYDGKSNTEYGLRIESNAAGGNFESDFANGTTALLDLYANSSTVTGGDLLVARTQSSTPVLLVKGNGNIGINEASPSTHLHVEQDNAHSSTYYLNTDAAILVHNKNASGKSTIKLEGEAAFVYGAGTSSLVIADRQNERLHIDSSGRVLIGGTSARTNFNNGTASPQIQIENVANGNKSSIALIHNENALSDSSSLHFAKTRGGTVGDDSALNQAGDRLGQIVFSGHDGSEFVQAATIEGLTDASPGNNDMPGRLSFSVTHDGASSPVERMRINRKGFLKMGPRITDSNHGVADLDSVRHEFTSDDNGWTIIVTHTSGAASEHEGILIDYNLDPNGTGNSFLQGNAGNNTRFRMASNGGLYNYQSNNSNLSDEREKKNIVSLDTKWDKVKSWELKKFHYNEDADSDDLRYGVIAQQVEQHCPEVLTEWIKQSAKDAVLDENENVVTPAVPEITRKGVKEQQMMWMAIKALQEAQTRIETLETQNADLLARVTALEGS